MKEVVILLKPLLEAIGSDAIGEEEDEQIEESIERERVRDIYLDANEDSISGAENDSDVNELVDKIPLDGEDSEVEKVIENFINYPS